MVAVWRPLPASSVVLVRTNGFLYLGPGCPGHRCCIDRDASGSIKTLASRRLLRIHFRQRGARRLGPAPTSTLVATADSAVPVCLIAPEEFVFEFCSLVADQHLPLFSGEQIRLCVSAIAWTSVFGPSFLICWHRLQSPTGSNSLVLRLEFSDR